MDVLLRMMVHFFGHHLLSAIIFLPLAGALVLLTALADRPRAARWVSLAVAAATAALGACLIVRTKGVGEFEFVEAASWIPSLGISYRVGVDGASALLIGMTALLAVCAVLASWREIASRVPLFCALLLLAEAGLVGVFAALDLFLFFIFWEAALIPMYFLIGIWGSGDRIRAAIAFVLFTMVGSALLLAALLYAGSAAGSFSLVEWYAHRFTAAEQRWLLAGLVIAFGIKVPLLGLHSWLPDAHAEAPTAGSVLLAGAFLKMGGYGLYRVALPLCPLAAQEYAPLLLALAVAGIVIGALLAMVQVDLKRLVAYSSISHMGFVVLGLAALERHAAAGAALQMVTHGLAIGGLFLLAGILSERRHTRLIADYGGTARSLPLIATAFIFMALSAMGLPGLAGFASEFLVLLGSFQTQTLFAAAATAGVVLMAIAFVWAIQRVFFGPLAHEEERRMPDLRAREMGSLALLGALIVTIGVWPQGAVGKLSRSADAFVALTKRVEMIIPAAPQVQQQTQPRMQMQAP
jgi:NADH-quinone oxidoreductase subunit M